jgi:hypothetical protein
MTPAASCPRQDGVPVILKILLILNSYTTVLCFHLLCMFCILHTVPVLIWEELSVWMFRLILNGWNLECLGINPYYYMLHGYFPKYWNKQWFSGIHPPLIWKPSVNLTFNHEVYSTNGPIRPSITFSNTHTITATSKSCRQLHIGQDLNSLLPDDGGMR